MAEARDATPLAERFVQRLTENEANVLDQMVRVALNIARCVDPEVEEGMARELL